MSELSLEVLCYMRRFGITPQLAALMKTLHEAEALATNDDMKEAMLDFARTKRIPKRLVDMGIYRLRQTLGLYDIKIHRIEGYGAYSKLKFESGGHRVQRRLRRIYLNRR